MSTEAAPNQAGLATNSKLRRRNVHTEENKEDGDQQQESSFMKSYVPKSLQRCISGEEMDRTQNLLATPEKVPSQKGPIHMQQEYECSQPVNKDLDTKDPFEDDAEVTELNISYNAPTTVSSMVSSNSDSSNLDSDCDFETSDKASFLTFRLSYLFVTLVVMLADGLQGKLQMQYPKHKSTFALYSHVFETIFFRYPSLRLVRGLRILCSIAILFGIHYGCYHCSHHGTPYR